MIKDLTGQKFGKYTVIEFSHKKSGDTYWVCRCDCGEIKTVRGYDLTHGRSTQCHLCAQKQFTKTKNPEILKKTRKPDTLCWGCQRAINKPDKMCVWARSSGILPVPGWIAKPVVIREGVCYGAINTFCVQTCPEYISDHAAKI